MVTPQADTQSPDASSGNKPIPNILERIATDKEKLIKEIETSIRNFDHQNFC